MKVLIADKFVNETNFLSILGNYYKKVRVDILFVCHGAPKQEKWLNLNSKNLNAKVAIGIGSAIDFIAGRYKRAPKWIQQIGLEWLFRLIQEPKRLWYRYLVRDIKFPFLFLSKRELFSVSLRP